MLKYTLIVDSGQLRPPNWTSRQNLADISRYLPTNRLRIFGRAQLPIAHSAFTAILKLAYSRHKWSGYQGADI